MKASRRMEALGIRILPGSDGAVENAEQAAEWAERLEAAEVPVARVRDVAVQAALDWSFTSLAGQYGHPRSPNGETQALEIVAMGKLGGRELNVSSDVDYIFVYPEDGETTGRTDGSGRIDNYDFFRFNSLFKY